MSKNGKPLAPGATDSEGIVIIGWEEDESESMWEALMREEDALEWERAEMGDWID